MNASATYWTFFFSRFVVLLSLIVPLGCFDLTFAEFPADDTDTETFADTDSDSDECEDGCLFGDICYSPGDTNPSNICEVCNPEIVATDWSSNDGMSCDDGLFCNGEDTCESRTCSVHVGDPCPEDDMFCNGEESCDELNDQCISAGDPCEAPDLCIENDDQCCQPNIPVGPPVCNDDDDSVQYDSCGYELLVDDCQDDVGTCVDGLCSCVNGLSGDDCDECRLIVKTGLSEYTDHDGGSWDTALESVQEGITQAKHNIEDLDEIDHCEVWVASGTYLPTEDEDGDSTPGNPRSMTFKLEPDVSLFGGFVGDEETLEERDFETNVTTLSGDLDGNDESDFENNSDNAYHVVTGADDAVIDGFVITGGNATGDDNEGGGMYNKSVDPSIANCRFLTNAAVDGGAMANAQSNPTITDCIFEGNSGVDGGGIHNNKSDPKIQRSLFINNYAENGAGIANTQSNPEIVGCTFRDNVAESGGGVKNVQSDTTFVNCLFQGNTADEGGGLRNVNSSPLAINCTFFQNTASKGGGMCSNNGSPEITNSIFWENEAGTSAQIHSQNSNPTITYSDVEGGCTEAGDCTSDDTGNIDSDPMFASDENLQLTCPAPPGDCSPCVDTGSNEALPSFVSTDLSGDLRIVDGDGDSTETVDMGAFEFQ